MNKTREGNEKAEEAKETFHKGYVGFLAWGLFSKCFLFILGNVIRTMKMGKSLSLSFAVF